ncbi:hypothetical protein SESBI_43576 [Sesbania bispinosa]|nr:hypothetical protein SESBI_43575 [Sesbania bispinosa]KAJ1383252.1 hypothetical protein SESBI_43576 [Sesbania bispinosa]
MPSEVDTALHDASICPRASGNAGVWSVLECWVYRTFGRMSCDRGVCAGVIHARACSSPQASFLSLTPRRHGLPPQEGVLGDFRATHVSHVRRRAGRPPVVHGQSLSSWMRCMRRSWAVDDPSSHLVSRSSVAPE